MASGEIGSFGDSESKNPPEAGNKALAECVGTHRRRVDHAPTGFEVQAHHQVQSVRSLILSQQPVPVQIGLS